MGVYDQLLCINYSLITTITVHTGQNKKFICMPVFIVLFDSSVENWLVNQLSTRNRQQQQLTA